MWTGCQHTQYFTVLSTGARWHTVREWNRSSLKFFIFPLFTCLGGIGEPFLSIINKGHLKMAMRLEPNVNLGLKNAISAGVQRGGGQMINTARSPLRHYVQFYRSSVDLPAASAKSYVNLTVLIWRFSLFRYRCHGNQFPRHVGQPCLVRSSWGWQAGNKLPLPHRAPCGENKLLKQSDGRYKICGLLPCV